MSVVVDFVEDVLGGAVEAVGDVLDWGADVVRDGLEAIDKYVVQPILDDPVTAIATAAGYMYGVPMAGIPAGAVGAGFANTAAGLVQGEDFDKAIKGGVISGLTIAGTEALGSYLSGAEGAAGTGVEGGYGGDFAPEVGVDIDAFGNAIEPMSYSSIPGPQTALADFSAGAGSLQPPIGIDQYVPGDYGLLPGSPDAAMPVNARLSGGSYLENAGGLDYGSGLNINQTTSTGLNVPGVTTGMTPAVTTPGVEPLNIQDIWNQGVAQIAPGDGLSGLDSSLDVLPRDYMTGEIDFSKAYDLGYGTETPYTPGISDYGGPPIEMTPKGVEIVKRDFPYEAGKEFSFGDTLSSIGDVGWEGAKAVGSFAMDNPLLALGALTLATMPEMPQPPQRGARESDAEFAARMKEFETKLQLYNYERSRQDLVGDITQYGYGPQQRFFTESQFVPIEPIETVADGGLIGDNMPAYYQYGQQSMQQMQRPLGMAAGGQMIRSPLAMGGVTDGRSDDVPAVLSDGEYVFDAETVALLGNGSSEAGAALLDQMRQNIRKHKGENLARGKISPDARSPLTYLRG